MEIVYLKKLGEGIYKPEKLAEIQELKQVDGVKNVKDMLSKPNRFVIAARMVDGTYHKVNSDISNIIKKNKDLILKGVGLIGIESEIYGSAFGIVQRYLIFDPRKNKEAYLLGEVSEAIQKLANYS